MWISVKISLHHLSAVHCVFIQVLPKFVHKNMKAIHIDELKGQINQLKTNLDVLPVSNVKTKPLNKLVMICWLCYEVNVVSQMLLSCLSEVQLCWYLTCLKQREFFLHPMLSYHLQLRWVIHQTLFSTITSSQVCLHIALPLFYQVLIMEAKGLKLPAQKIVYCTMEVSSWRNNYCWKALE